MGAGSADRDYKMYFLNQSILLFITFFCLIFLTIPTVRTFLDVSNREKIETAKNEAQQQKDPIDTDLKKVRVEMLMSGTAPETNKALKEREARLEMQLAAVGGQLADLQQRFDRVEHAVKELPSESIMWQILARLGHILHVGVPAVSGTLFVTSWIRRRREQETSEEAAGSSKEIPSEKLAESIEAGKP